MVARVGDLHGGAPAAARHRRRRAGQRRRRHGRAAPAIRPCCCSSATASASIPDGVQFAWNSAVPFPGGVPSFTTSTPLAEGAGAAGGGQGAGAIVVRFRVDGTDTLSRARPRRGRPLRRGRHRRAGRLRPAERPGRRDLDGGHDRHRLHRDAGSSGRRAAYVARLSGNRFGNPRVISLTGAGPIATAVGPREAGLVAWTRSGRAELSLLDDRARAGRYRVLGKAATSGDIAATGTAKGALVAWEGPGGSIRVVRRGSASSGVFAKPVTARARNGSDVSGLTVALDPLGVAYVTWREGTRLGHEDPRRARQVGAPLHRSRASPRAPVSAGPRRRPGRSAAPSSDGPPRSAGRRGACPRTGGLPIQSTVSAPGTSTACRSAGRSSAPAPARAPTWPGSSRARAPRGST